MRRLVLLLLCLPAAKAAEEYTWWVEPCPAETARATGCAASDPELAAWAFAAWERESGGTLKFRPGPNEEHARIRIHWANGAMNLYGETQPAMVDGQRGAIIYVLPDTRALGRDIDQATRADTLLRDAIVYLTCLHETGHALGLSHTAQFADIMYTFQYGGDIPEYFNRYRRLLKTRPDIPKHSGISDADRAALRRLY